MTTSTIPTSAGTRLPRLLYGTAWKKESTADCVYEALQAGFRGIDTAAQPRHYREDLVAAGVRRALADGTVARRGDLYIQTKFTPPSGQDWGRDERKEGWIAPPYDVDAPLADQVRQSVESSLRHFAVETDPPTAASYVDCLVLHSPCRSREDTRAVWRALQPYVEAGRIRSLGVSNVSLADLQVVVEVAAEVAAEEAEAKTEADSGKKRLCPAVVQNRFYGSTSHDVDLRRFCGRSPHGIIYQSFWTLTANPGLLGNARRQQAAGIAAVAAGADVSPAVAMYALVTLGLGGRPGQTDQALCPVVVLDGTTSPSHMRDDLAGLAQVEAWAATAEHWPAAVEAFRIAIGESQ